MEIKGFNWTIEAKIICALMRKLNVTEIKITARELVPPKGMLISGTSRGKMLGITSKTKTCRVKIEE
jgi:hypothetical protein